MMVLNLEQLPAAITEDVEAQSLALLSDVQEHLTVIGGWAVRAWTHDIAVRNTIDVDGVAGPEDMTLISQKLRARGLAADAQEDWGTRFHMRYTPSSVEAAEAAREIQDILEEVQLRVEVSQPRIYERGESHFFEFDTERASRKRIASRGGSASVECRVADSHELAANKAGLPADYKNIFDLALLLTVCDLGEVIRIIDATDDWRAVVLRRIPKILGRVRREDNTAHILLRAFDLDIDEFVGSTETVRDAIV
jgi:hypothetical protein